MECKKRAAELRDEILFRQPISSHFGDCPICFLPHSIDHNEFKLMTCCCNAICVCCAYTNELREREGTCILHAPSAGTRFQRIMKNPK